jgi:hypothetical protein
LQVQDGGSTEKLSTDGGVNFDEAETPPTATEGKMVSLNGDEQEDSASASPTDEQQTDLDPIKTSSAEDQESFIGMHISDHEVEMLKHLAPFAGSSPRRGLRFVNVYRLIKTSLAVNQLDTLVGKTGEELAYRAIICQLAISTGAPSISQQYFKIILSKDVSIQSINELIDELNKVDQTSSSSEWGQLIGALEKLRELNTKQQLDVGVKMTKALRDYAPIARRYSFTARPA